MRRMYAGVFMLMFLANCTTPEGIDRQKTAYQLANDNTVSAESEIVSSCSNRLKALARREAEPPHEWIEYSSTLTSHFSQIFLKNGREDIAETARINVFKSEDRSGLIPRINVMACLTVKKLEEGKIFLFIVRERRNGYSLPSLTYQNLVSELCEYSGGSKSIFGDCIPPKSS